MTPPARAGGQAGSAAAEFVMIAALLLALFLGAVQLTVFLHVRNLARDAAVHGARYGSLADRGPADARSRAADLARGSLGGRTVREVGAGTETHGDTSRVVVTVRVAVPVVGVLPGPWTYTARASATRFDP